MGFSRLEYWRGLSFPSPGDLPNPGIKPTFLHWQVESLLLSHQGIPLIWVHENIICGKTQNGQALGKRWKTDVGVEGS